MISQESDLAPDEGAAEDAGRETVTAVPPGPDPTTQELLRHFESIGGAGHGSEFEQFLSRHGARSVGLLGWADLAADLLIQALEQRFIGVGEAENTAIFKHDDSGEWWTRDRRYWMAMPTFVNATSDTVGSGAEEILARTRALRARLIAELTAGRKLFVFRDVTGNLDEARLNRLHAAIRAFGPSTLFYLRYEDEAHPAGLVEAVKPGLLVGYVAHFAFGRDMGFIAQIDDVLMQLCRQALALHTRLPGGDAPALPPGNTPPEPPAAPPALAPRGAPELPRRVRGPRSSFRRIVFFGNCQVGTMASLYRRYIMPGTRDRLEVVANYEALNPRALSLLNQADLIVEQVMDMAADTEVAGIAPGTPRVHVPMVTAAFLWPFRAPSHPHAVSLPFAETGAFDSENCDSYLNRQILAGADPEEAVEAYLNLDINKMVNLDRMYELMIDRQRDRDKVTDYDIAGIIERHFRSEYLFLTPYHPNVRVSLALADELFRRLGAKQDDIDRMRARTRVTPFSMVDTPVHPTVARHWQLDYIAPDQRYRFRHEGAFTFREFALRYMRHDWNPSLEEGMWLYHQGRIAEAIAALRTALAVTPDSAIAYQVLGEALARQGDKEAALTELLNAAALDSTNGPILASFGNALREVGHLTEAADVLRQAVAADPTEPHYSTLLAHTLRQDGKLAEAGAAFEQALDVEPRSAETWLLLADVREAAGDLAGAEAALRQAIQIDQSDITLQKRLAEILARQARQADALLEARRAVDQQPHTARARLFLSEALRSEGDLKAAVAEALAAAVMAPFDGEAQHNLGCLLRDSGDLAGAEAAFRKAITMAPANAHYRHQFSALCLQLGHLPAATKAAEEAIAREPGNPFRYEYLANVLATAHAFDRARDALRTAISAAPEHVPFRIAFSDLFAREGRLQEALDAAREVVRDAPDSAQAVAYLAHVELMSGLRQDAMDHLREAVGMAPDDPDLRRRLDEAAGTPEVVQDSAANGLP